MFMHVSILSLRQLHTFLIQGICQNLQTMIDIIPVRKFALILSKNKVSKKQVIEIHFTYLENIKTNTIHGYQNVCL